MKLYRKKKFIGKVYPGGEFSCGYDVASYTAEKRRSKEYERIHALQHHALRDEEGEVLKRIPLDEAEIYCPSEVEGQQARLDIGLSTIQNSRKTGKRYGLKGITSYGKRMLKAGAFLLEKEYGKKRLTFATFTLPTMSEEMRQVVHEHWGEIINRFYEGITYELRKHTESVHIVGCSEVQESRGGRTGEFYLHLHCLWVGRGKTSNWWITPRRARQNFAASVRCVLRHYTGNSDLFGQFEAIDWSACERLEAVKKSVVGYLGKYISKGSKSLSSIPVSKRLEVCPRQWWNITQSLRRRILDSIIKLTEREADALVNDPDIQKHAAIWVRKVSIFLSGYEYTCGAIGRLSRAAYDHLVKNHRIETPLTG